MKQPDNKHREREPKLKLQRQTLRRLDPASLALVAGGYEQTTRATVRMSG